jgi:acetyltransferase-like isoleucine patch superfamily enzyme
MKSFAYNIFYFLLSFFLEVLNVFPDNAFGNRIRGSVFGLIVRGKPKNLQISKRVNILSPRNVEIGNDVYIGYGVWINGYGMVTIADGVMFGPYCTVSSANHTKGSSGGFRWGDHEKSSVVIGRGSWLGAMVNVLPGARIAEGVLIGAGSTIRGDTYPNGLYVGEIAKLKKVEESEAET